MLSMEAVTKVLRENGFKVTPQRLAVYKALSSTKEHPNAEMLYAILHPQYPTMSLATVYKTMDMFSEIGLVQVLNVGEDSYRYDARTGSHHHIRCMSCNKVEDLFFSDEKLIQEVAEYSKYILTGKQLYFFGKCPLCQENELVG